MSGLGDLALLALAALCRGLAWLPLAAGRRLADAGDALEAIVRRRSRPEPGE